MIEDNFVFPDDLDDTPDDDCIGELVYDGTPEYYAYRKAIYGEFHINEHGVVTNPNIIEGGDKKFSFEIRTAVVKGKWRYAISFNYPTGGHSGPVSEYCEPYDSERTAVCKGAYRIQSLLLKHNVLKNADVFKQVVRIINEHKQLSLF